jgi:hypothetical protein
VSDLLHPVKAQLLRQLADLLLVVGGPERARCPTWTNKGPSSARLPHFSFLQPLGGSFQHFGGVKCQGH